MEVEAAAAAVAGGGGVRAADRMRECSWVDAGSVGFPPHGNGGSHGSRAPGEGESSGN